MIFIGQDAGKAPPCANVLKILRFQRFRRSKTRLRSQGGQRPPLWEGFCMLLCTKFA